MCTHATRVAMSLSVVYLSRNACKENRRGGRGGGTGQPFLLPLHLVGARDETGEWDSVDTVPFP